MDPRFMGLTGCTNGIQLDNQSLPFLKNENFHAIPRCANSFLDRVNGENHYHIQSDPPSTSAATISNFSNDEDSPEDCDFSDAILSYIHQMLMEEDMEEKTCMLQDSLDLQAAEKPFYDVLGQKYPPSPEQNSVVINSDTGRQDESPSEKYNDVSGGTDVYNYYFEHSNLQDPVEILSRMKSLPGHSIFGKQSYSISNSAISNVDGQLESPNSILQIPYLNSDSQSVWQFRKGVEEASKFLPNGDDMLANLDVSAFLQKHPEPKSKEELAKVEKDEPDCLTGESRGRKHPHGELDVGEERSNKQAALYTETTLRSDMFDAVLLCSNERNAQFSAIREAFENAKQQSVPQDARFKIPRARKGRGRARNGTKEVIDLRTILVHCAQAVAADDHRSAHEMLKQIRQHSSPFGDGNQRLAYWFADGLEARLAGTGSQIYKGLVSKRTSAADLLKAYHLYLAACPFRRVSNFASNKTIMEMAKNSVRVHVIDFGILYGFQWPTFIQRLSCRNGGAPKLRITGIDFPQPGFRPAERVEETGRRLANYAESFNIPFEYNAIVNKWETIQLEELKIEEDEFVVVNCLYRAKNLPDESVAVESSRTKFLNLVRKINPNIFIHGITNGAFNAPFFVTRFREALFHYSSLFDMLETVVPREDRERMLIEKEIFGREALNVIACEGCERVERPESYKQWHARILRAGFTQLRFDQEIVEKATHKVKTNYHRDFLIDEDSLWLLQGWKGRITLALSCWKPA